MLVTDGATEMYDDVFEKFNWPERKVSLDLAFRVALLFCTVLTATHFFLNFLLSLHFFFRSKCTF